MLHLNEKNVIRNIEKVNKTNTQHRSFIHLADANFSTSHYLIFLNTVKLWRT